MTVVFRLALTCPGLLSFLVWPKFFQSTAFCLAFIIVARNVPCVLKTIYDLQQETSSNNLPNYVCVCARHGERAHAGAICCDD